MSWVGSARDEVLLAIRRALYGARGEKRVTRAAPAPDPVDPRVAALADASVRVEHFRALCEMVGGKVHAVADLAAASRVLAAILERTGARDVALSDAPLVRELWASCGVAVRAFEGWSERRRLFECDLGLSTAQWGIAETGTLVLDSSREKHRLVSLVPPVHVALLRRSDLLGTLGEALERARGEGASPPSTLTFVTGPSRTADIELTLVVGVHGPRELHVLLLESDPS